MQMEFFPLYVEQMEENERFKSLSPTKKCYYFLLQSMFNRQGEFYFSDTNFAAALGCSHETVTKARREFVKNGWIQIQPGMRDKTGRGVSTIYKFVRWANTPKQDEKKRFARVPRYAFEMTLRRSLPYDDIVLWCTLIYWKHLYELEDGNFFITKSKLKDITGIKGMYKLEKSIDRLYNSIEYRSGDRLFEYQDKYHQIKFTKFSLPEESMENQRIFWEGVIQKGRDLQKKKQAKSKTLEYAKLKYIYNFFEKEYEKRYGGVPKPYDEQINRLIMISKRMYKKTLTLKKKKHSI